MLNAVVSWCSGTAVAQERQDWVGEILMPNASCPRLTFIVTFRREGEGEWIGSLSIPRGCGIYGVIDSPLQSVVVSEARLAFSTLAPTENLYEAVRPGAASEAGVFKGQVLIAKTQAVPIRMWRVSEAEAVQAAPKRPQMPTGEPAYVVQGVRVPIKLGGEDAELAGVLSMPLGEGPFAAVVLVSDEEAQDRDHTEGTHRPFLVLSDRLVRAGYAVLRCDDRGMGESAGSTPDATMEEVAADVAAQVAFLRGRERIAPGKVGVIGRGEGAVLGAMAAVSGERDVAFLAMLAPPGRKGIDLACLREERQLQGVGEDATYVANRVGRLRRMLELAMAGEREALEGAVREDVRAYVTERRGMGTPMTPDQVSMWASSRVEMLTGRRFLSRLANDPADWYRRLSCPVLVLSGELDLMTPTPDEFPLVKGALEASRSGRVVAEVLPRTNHWMQPCATGYQDEVDLIETTFSERALGAIVAFLAEATAGK
jgi:pimeloyl-ACP methyl ester carboxylesterase